MRKRTAKLTKIEALESHSSPNPSNSQNSHREPNGDPENPHIQTGKWSRREYFLFYQYYLEHGPKWSEIARLVGTRTREQVRSHAQKNLGRLLCQAKKEEKEIKALAMIEDDGGKIRTRRNLEGEPARTQFQAFTQDEENYILRKKIAQQMLKEAQKIDDLTEEERLHTANLAARIKIQTKADAKLEFQPESLSPAPAQPIQPEISHPTPISWQPESYPSQNPFCIPYWCYFVTFNPPSIQLPLNLLIESPMFAPEYRQTPVIKAQEPRSYIGFTHCNSGNPSNGIRNSDEGRERERTKSKTKRSRKARHGSRQDHKESER